jgi:tetratricopeptide (TPR) repeat protein
MACGRMHPVAGHSRAGASLAPGSTPFRSLARTGRWPLLIAVLTAFLIAPRPGLADPVQASVTARDNGGYARIVFAMSDYDAASVRKEGSVLVISFKEPIDVSVDRLATQVPDYIGAARLDPDGMAVRLALAREVTVNAMAAGEQYFVDLLPDTWKGLPPSLPQEVVEDLARRAHEAEEMVERERRIVELEKIPPVHVRLATEPTFSRFVFGIPQQVSVTAIRDKTGLTLTFDAPLKFDLVDVEAALPSTVAAIKTQLQDTSASVHFDLPGRIDVRTFRDENGYAVDVVGAGAKPGAKGAAQVPQTTARQASPPITTPALTVPGASPKGAKAAEAASQPPAASAQEPADAVPAAPAKPPSPPAKSATASVAPAVAPPTTQAAAQPPPATQPSVAAPPSESEAATKKAAPPAGVAALPVAPPTARTAAQPAPATQPSVAAPPSESAAATKKAAPPASKPAAAAVTPKPPPLNAGAGDKIPVDLAREGQNLKLSFDFMTPTAASVFMRADTLWLVFDSKADIDLSALKDEASRTIRSAELTRAPDADVVRIKLDRPHLSSVGTEGPVWTVVIGDTVADPMHALDLDRTLLGPKRSSVSIELDVPHELHRISDPEAGDQLLVVTAFAPARGVIRTQNFIDFRALASEQGVVIEPLADDLTVGLASDKVVISRPGGLFLSSSLQSLLSGNELHPLTFDPQLWGFDRKGSYEKRQSDLIAAAAAAPENKRLQPRLALARFYLARSMYPEAKGVLDVVLSDKRPASEDVTATVLRAVAEIMMGRPAAALKDLADPSVGDQHEAPLWRALAYARQGKWGQARESFKKVEAAIATLPIELQRFALKEEMRASIEVKDFGEAESELNDLQTIGIPHRMQPEMSVLVGRLDEGLGRTEDALAAYRAAADSWDRPAAAQARLRETVLRYSLGDLKRREVVSDLESLTTLWRGDETEIEALRILAKLYTEEGRYRDSFYVMRSAMTAHPDWDMTRKIQEDAAKTFDSLFLAGKGDSMSAIDALALFYDFRELTPIGSRGDEMIRRLADRLVSVDLLDQAAGLLQYQVDNRLQGAARAEVAARLAVIYLMDRKPDKAVEVLRATRTADLSTELRDERLLLEARALSDLGQRDLALEVATDVKGRAALRLRSDIYWAAHKWRESAEQIELMYGDRWKQWQPLTDVERSDIVRAEVGYALAEDKLDLERFRDRYGPKMAGTPDAHTFQIVSAPIGTGGEAFQDIARTAAAADTLDDFLREMKESYPEANPISSEPTADAAPAAAAAAPAPPSPAPPQTRPARPVAPAASAVPPVPSTPPSTAPG